MLYKQNKEMDKKQNINLQDYLTVPEYAKQYVKRDGTIGVHQNYIHSLIRDGKLPIVDLGKRLRLVHKDQKIVRKPKKRS